MRDVYHVTSRTRPSRFSACNIEKLGMGLGTRLYKNSYMHNVCRADQLRIDINFQVVYLSIFFYAPQSPAGGVTNEQSLFVIGGNL